MSNFPSKFSHTSCERYSNLEFCEFVIITLCYNLFMVASGTESETPLLFGKTGQGNILNPTNDDEYFERIPISHKEVLVNQAEVKATPYRWLILLIFSVASWINSILWITFAPIAVQAEAFYETTPLWINCMDFSITFLPCTNNY